jgi:hypothetical protein
MGVDCHATLNICWANQQEPINTEHRIRGKTGGVATTMQGG